MTAPLPLTEERAQRWRAAQPPARRRGLAPVLLWALTIVLVTAMTPEGGCTPVEPCGADWTGALEFVLVLAAPVLLLWWWPLGRWVSVVAAVCFAVVESWRDVVPLWLAIGLPLLVLLATAEAWVDRARRARATKELCAASPTEQFPGPVEELAAWPWPRTAAAALLVTAPVLLGYGVVHGRSEAALEQRASQVTGSVTAHGPDGYLVTVSFGDRTEDFATYAADYPVGSEQPVLVLPDGQARLAADRYDPSGWLARAVAAALAGLTLGGRTREHYRQVRGLLAQPAPVHLVRLARGPAATQVLPIDANRSLIEARLALADSDTEVDDGERGKPKDDNGDAGESEIVEATLYGGPIRGGVVGAVLADGRRLLHEGRVGRGDPAWHDRFAELEVRPGETSEAPPATAAELATWRRELLRPEPLRSTLGLALVLGSLAAVFVIARESGGALSTLWRCGLAATFAFDGVVRLVSRVRLTPAGLVHEGPTTRRTVPWESLTTVTVVNGAVLARTEHDTVPLPWLPRRPRFARQARRREWAHRWAAVIAAEARQHAATLTQPTRAEPRLWGPALAVVFTVTVLAGLQAR